MGGRKVGGGKRKGKRVEEKKIHDWKADQLKRTAMDEQQKTRTFVDFRSVG